MMINIAKLSAAFALGLAVAPHSTMALSLPLRPTDLTVHLEQCRVEISMNATQNPALRVLRTDGSEVPLESIGVSVSNNVVRVRDQEGQDSLNDLVFSFMLQPTQNFQIEGANLDLTVTGPETSDQVAKDDQKSDRGKSEGEGCVAPRLLNLVGGAAHVTGGGCTKIILTDADLTLDQTSQTLEIEATGGRFRIQNHQGNITLNAQEYASGVIVGNQGDLEVTMTQGQLTVEGGTGAIKGQSENSALVVSGHNGRFEGSGSDSELQILNSLMALARLTGTRILSQFSGGQGNIRATLEGGSLSIDDWAGRIDLQSSRGTTVDIEAVEGDFAFSIVDGNGEVTDITGHTRGILADSDMEFSRLKSIEITASASQTSVKDVPQITQMNIVGGHLDFESSNVGGKPKIDLSAEATADIMIPQPCIVRCDGPGAKNLGNIRVSGCEFRAQGQPWGKKHRQAKPSLRLEVTMQEDTEVVVSGY
ncbi:MAG: hypothetical protein DRJ65_00835 [Acidobacteria bacterium]|nr:MAG: hypothetical protein DRJ65_00835 [Acidobacteriota bacterium]